MYGAGHFSLPAWLAGAFSRTFAGTRQPEQCLHFTLCWLLAVAFLLELTSLFFFCFPPKGCSEHLQSLSEINKCPCLFAVRRPIHLWWSREESPWANGASRVLCIPTRGASLALLCTTRLYVLAETPGLCLLLSARSAPRAAVMQALSSLFCRSWKLLNVTECLTTSWFCAAKALMSGCSPQSSFLPLALRFLALLGLILSLLSLTVAITHSTGASASKFFWPVSWYYSWWHPPRGLSCLFSLQSCSRFLLWFLFLSLLPILFPSPWLPISNAVLGGQVPFMPQICRQSKLSKSLGQALTAAIFIKDWD